MNKRPIGCMSFLAFAVMCALDSIADISYSIKLPYLDPSGGPGISISWNPQKHDGGTSITVKDAPFTIWRDGVAIATVSNRSTYTDYDVVVGSTHTYRVSGYGVSSQNQTKDCELDYVSSVDGDLLRFTEKSGSATISASETKRKRVKYTEDGVVHYRIDTTKSSFTVARSESWIKKASYSSANCLLTVTVAENTGVESRSATVTLTDHMKRTYTINIIQAAKGDMIYISTEDGGEIAIPKTYIDTSAATFLSAAGGDYETAANAEAANGMKVWECYIAGLDPTNPESRFVAEIEMRDGLPVITWKPNLNEEQETRIYTIYGNATLDENGWTSPTNSLHRFFKVGVKLP